MVVDLITVEYAGGDKLYLPVYRLNQIQKFQGGEGTPKLDRLGGQTFAKTKAKVEKSLRKMADELLRLYAERRSAIGEPTAAASAASRTATSARACRTPSAVCLKLPGVCVW